MSQEQIPYIKVVEMFLIKPNTFAHIPSFGSSISKSIENYYSLKTKSAVIQPDILFTLPLMDNYFKKLIFLTEQIAIVAIFIVTNVIELKSTIVSCNLMSGYQQRSI